MKERDADRWVRELHEAGWKEHGRRSTVWISPSGALYMGPYGAWNHMKAGAK